MTATTARKPPTPQADAGNPSQILVRLRALTGEAGHNYFVRISLVHALLQNAAWLQSEHGGDSYRAAEALEDNYFHDVCGAVTLWQLLQIYQRFPAEADWQKHGYHIGKMLEACKPAQEEAPCKTTRTVVKKAEMEAVQNRAAEAESQLKARVKEIKAKDQQIVDLQDQVAKLKTENSKLLGRVEELERVLGNKLAKISG